MSQESYPGYEHRIQYYETDQMGCVHHSNYIRWFEEIRSDYLDFLGMGYDCIEAAGIISPVLTVQAEYKSMARYGETVHIQIRIQKYNGIRLVFGYEIRDQKDGTLRCQGESSHCFLNKKGRPLALKKVRPEWDAKLVEQMRSEEN